MTQSEIIGFVGIGAMGMPMVGNLASAGYPLQVFDLDCGRTEALARQYKSINVANSLAELGAAVDIVITMLPDGKTVQIALCGNNDSFEDCLLEHASPGTLVIDMSSSSPLGTCNLGQLLAEHDVSFVDAPVSGGVKGAIAASRAIMVGGDETIFERVQPLAFSPDQLTRVETSSPSTVTSPVSIAPRTSSSSISRLIPAFASVSFS